LAAPGSHERALPGHLRLYRCPATRRQHSEAVPAALCRLRPPPAVRDLPCQPRQLPGLAFPTGLPTDTCEEALDTACGLYPGRPHRLGRVPELRPPRRPLRKDPPLPRADPRTWRRLDPQALASSYSTTERAVEVALAGPPLPPVRLHDLRHGAASLTYRATKDLKLVSELLGHSGIQITADTYTTLFAEVDAAAAEAVAALVPRAYPTGQVKRTSAEPENPAVRTM
jgi:hypothetical protein